MNVQASFADAVEDGDYGSAGRLWLMAREQGARATAERVEARFPNLRTFVATATTDSLGIVGDSALRRGHRDLRDGDGWTTESARRERDRHQRGGDEGSSSGSIALGRAMSRLALLVTFPWPQLIRWAARRHRHRMELRDDTPPF